MAKDRSSPLDKVTFQCPSCRRTFSAAPERVEECPEQEHHPFAYFAACVCGAEARQATYERNLMKAWANATGPKTADGKAAVAANLEGHPTPEEAKRTRFNAMKTGLYARTATYFPAKPGGYAFCDGCDVDPGWCARQPACTKKTELFMLHHAAFDQNNPKHLKGMYADLQAALFSVVQQIVQTIMADGVKIQTPEYYKKPNSEEIVIAEYVDESGTRRILMREVMAHPLFKPLGELLSRNNLSLADMGMTQKVLEDVEQDQGRLKRDEATQEALADFSRNQVKALEDLRGLMARANASRDKDPILAEFTRVNGDGSAGGGEA